MNKPTTLDCGHIELKDGHCATTDCARFIGVDESWAWTLPEEYRG